MTRAIRLPESKRFAGGVLLASTSGLLLTFAYPPISWWPLSYFALTPLVRSLRHDRQAFYSVPLAGATFGGFWFLGTQHWIFQLHGPGLLSTFIPWPALLALTVFVLFGMITAFTLSMLSQLHLPSAWALPISWYAAETAIDTLVRCLIRTTFDINSLAITQHADSPFACLAAIGGLPLVSAAVCCINGSLDDILRQNKLAVVLVPILGLICILSHSVSAHSSRNDRRIASQQISVIMCSTRLPSESDALEQLRAVARKADLVVFPEMAVDGISNFRSPPEEAVYAARYIDRPIAVPCVRISDDMSSLISSLLVIDPSGRCQVLANKRFPGPFHESETPIENALRLRLGVTFSRVGETPIVYEPTTDVVEVKGMRIGAGICHDVCFPEWSSEQSQIGGEFLIVSANCTFDPTGTVASRILSCARLRAIQSGCPLMLCSFGGPSAAFDSNGRQIGGIEAGNDEWTLVRIAAKPGEHRAGEQKLEELP